MAHILQPIIRRLESYGDYPFEAIEPSALLLLEEANATLAFEQKKQFEVLKRSLECFLQITDQRLSSITIGRPEFSDTYRSFVGALNSERFVDRPLSWRYTMTRAMNALVIALRVVKKAPKIHTLSVKSNALTTDIKSCVLEFDSLVLNEESVWCWRGWVSYNKSGNPIFLPLYPVYKRLGRDFTDRFFAVCNGFLTARRQSHFSCLKPLAKFIGLYEKQFGPSDFCDPQFTTDFWRDFFSFYLVTGYANGDGSKVSTLVSEWRKNLTHFVSEYLQPSGLFAEPWGQFPSPEPKYVSGARTYVRTTSEGHDVKTKLLTDIPLHVSDEEALELLFHRIEADVNVFANWAEWAAKSIWSRYQRRRELETKGTAREIQKKGIWHCGDLIWKTGRKNPEHLTNAAATLAHHGFLCSSDITLPEPKLALMTAKQPGGRELYRLVPIARHDLTFLIEFIEKNRRRIVRNTCGLENDDGYVLISETTGHKLRPNTITQEIATLAKAAGILERSSPHLFRHAFITKLFVALIEQHSFENVDDFRRALLDTEGIKAEIQQWTGHRNVNSLDTYIHMAFATLTNFKKTLSAVNVGRVIESFKGSVAQVRNELGAGMSSADAVQLLYKLAEAVVIDLEVLGDAAA